MGLGRVLEAVFWVVSRKVELHRAQVVGGTPEFSENDHEDEILLELLAALYATKNDTRKPSLSLLFFHEHSYRGYLYRRQPSPFLTAKC